jgi:transcriptional regulator with XRE-family HTH domain
MQDSSDKKIHHGQNVKRFREMLGMKQEAFAAELGEDWSQRRVSLLEAKEEIAPELLEQVAKVLKVPAEAIKNFDEQAAVNFISNTFNNTSNDHSTFNAVNTNPTFNPIDKVVQLYDEKIELYERMLKDKNEMIEKLEKVIASKKQL